MVTTIDDYMQVVCERFPQLTEKEIKKILTFGFRMYHYVNKMGCDVLVKDDVTNKYTMFTGNLGYCPLKHYNRGLFKWRMKERTLYRLKKIEWDGYYYFGVNEEKYQDIKKQLETKNRRNIQIGKMFFYKVLKEIEHDHSVKHIFKVKYPIDCGYKFIVNKYSTKELEYIGENKIKIWNTKEQTVFQAAL